MLSLFPEQTGVGHLQRVVYKLQSARFGSIPSVRFLRSHLAGPEMNVKGVMGKFTLADIEGALLLLGGGAVVNWHRLSFGSREEIRTFLKTNEYDLDWKEDEERIRTLIHESVQYIRRTFAYEFPLEVSNPNTVEDLFLLCASRDAYQKLACMTLKVVHVLNHLQAQ